MPLRVGCGSLSGRHKKCSAGAGVALVFIAAVPRSQVSGAVTWLSSSKAMIALSRLGRFEDRFAAEVLIPHCELTDLSGTRGTREAVTGFADRLGVSPAIVVGRMQHEDWLPRSHLNALKRRFVLKNEGRG